MLLHGDGIVGVMDESEEEYRMTPSKLPFEIVTPKGVARRWLAGPRSLLAIPREEAVWEARSFLETGYAAQSSGNN